MIIKEQADEIKKKLAKQIESSQLENKEQIREYLKGLNEEELEEFLAKNKIKISDSAPPSKCIFCSILNDEIPSHKLAENKKSLAILEINPLSRGHVLILPKEHTTIDRIPKSALGLAQKMARRIKKKIRPEDVKIETSSFQEHAIINVIPFYKDEKIEKKKASEKELEELQLLLETKKRKPREAKNKPVEKEILKSLPRITFRIP